MALKLIIANKNYSSWSMRPWLALRHHEIPFEEVVIPLGRPDTKARMLEYSPAGKVPILIDGDAVLWESFAILEHIGEKFPETQLWPQEHAARAHARSVACEMHGGFADLRKQCPMNLRRHKGRTISPEAQSDVKRVTAIWRGARERFGAGGAFLFGAFSAADCMYAPVAARLRSYEIEVDPVSAAYIETIYSLPAFREWQEAGISEPWTYASTEAVD